MPFTPKNYTARGKIHAVTVGTGEKTLTLGGQSVLPFYLFDGPMPHRPVIGLEIAHRQWDVPGLQAFYAGCETLGEKARRACRAGADFIALNLEAADPNGEDLSVEACVADALSVADAVELPLAILGCRNPDKDGVLFPALAEALAGKNVLFLSAVQENYQQIAPAIIKYGHKLCGETADDVTLAKQLNILLTGDAAMPAEHIVMNIGTAPVGYGFEYVASTMDRIREAALQQNDLDLVMPILAPVAADAWGVKEATATEEDEPAWGDREERGICMEIATAAANLTGGADGVILRHPEGVKTVREFICGLMGGEDDGA